MDHAALIDGLSDLSVNAQEVSPVLTFSTSDDELEFAGGSSWMHDYGAKQISESFPSGEQIPYNPARLVHLANALGNGGTDHSGTAQLDVGPAKLGGQGSATAKTLDRDGRAGVDAELRICRRRRG
jgi:hypothetical protein